MTLSIVLSLVLLFMTWRELQYWRMPRNLDPRRFVPSLPADGHTWCYTCARARWLVWIGADGEELKLPMPCCCHWLNHWWDNGWRPGEEWTGPIMGKCSDWGRGP